MSYYGFLSHEVEIRATDAAEVADITFVDGHHVDVTIRERKNGAEPYFRRRFTDRETREIRIRMWGRDDRVVVRGSGDAGIAVRIVGGAGDDELVDAASASRLTFHDDAGQNRFESSNGARLDNEPYTEWVGSDLNRYPPREWGAWWRPLPWFAVNNDLGAFVGGGFLRAGYGFRKSPYASNIAARIGFSTRATALKAELDGDFRRENAAQYWRVHALASGIEVLRYYGLGNDTDEARGTDFHRVHMTQFAVEPSAALPVGRAEVYAGPIVRYSHTQDEDGRYITGIAPTLYGAGYFGQAGARGGFAWSTRDSDANTQRGSSVFIEGRVFPAIWDVVRPFGVVKAETSTYRSASTALTPTVALRLGGQKNWGVFPFQESAFLGGPSNLRGFPRERFAGEASLFGNAELRLTVGRTSTALPAVWGVFGHADAGRVWAGGASPGGWHSSVGGGVWVAVIDRANTFRIGVSTSREQTSFYLGAGMAF